MYKVIIVDDEDIIREGLKTFVDWGAMGFDIVGEASNGNEAMELIQELKPHVVLTDIKMPCCTGIELMENIKNEGISCKIVVLSGYDEFDYVRKALEVGAVDYLLKPIKFDKLKEVFSRIKTDYDCKIKENIKKNIAFNLLKEQFLAKLVNGIIKDENEIVKQAAEMGLEFVSKYYMAVIVEIDDYAVIEKKFQKTDIELFKFMIKNIADEVCADLGTANTINMADDKSAVIIGVYGCKFDQVRAVISHMKESVDNALNLTTTVSIGEAYNKVSMISLSYKTAKQLSGLKFRLGKDRIICVDDKNYNACNCTGDENIDNLENKLVLMLQNYDIQGQEQLIEQALYQFKKKNEACKVYFDIVNCVDRYLQKKGRNIYDIVPDELLKYDSVMTMETIGDMAGGLKDILSEVAGSLRDSDHKNTSKVVEMVKANVREHLHENVSLESIAAQVHMHPVYLSKIFKKETGMTFINYLTSARIDKAKELMGDITLKMYEISQKVGYSCPKHFSKVFKTVTGVTPTEYRKSVLD